MPAGTGGRSIEGCVDGCLLVLTTFFVGLSLSNAVAVVIADDNDRDATVRTGALFCGRALLFGAPLTAEVIIVLVDFCWLLLVGAVAEDLVVVAEDCALTLTDAVAFPLSFGGFAAFSGSFPDSFPFPIFGQDDSVVAAGGANGFVLWIPCSLVSELYS